MPVSSGSRLGASEILAPLGAGGPVLRSHGCSGASYRGVRPSGAGTSQTRGAASAIGRRARWPPGWRDAGRVLVLLSQSESERPINRAIQPGRAPNSPRFTPTLTGVFDQRLWAESQPFVSSSRTRHGQIPTKRRLPYVTMGTQRMPSSLARSSPRTSGLRSCRP
jgi:hypothetical protein